MFFCDLLFSYRLKRDYVGDFNYKNTANMQVQRAFWANGLGTDSPPLVLDKITGIIINGEDFGSGRVVSYGNPVSYDITEDGKHLWKQTVNLELFEDGDSSNLPATNFAISDIYNKYIQSVDESFSFDITENGDYQFSRDFGVKCIRSLNEDASGSGIAYGIMQAIQSANRPDFGFIDVAHSGVCNNFLGKTTNSYRIDKENGSVNWSEKFLIQSRDFLKHTFSFDNGVINVTESALIRHSGISSASGVLKNDEFLLKTRYDNLLLGSMTRCSGLVNVYSSALGADAYANYLVFPTQITKAFDEKSQELNYSISFSNNPNMTTSGYLIEREINLSRASNGTIEASESASVTHYSNKTSGLMTTMIGIVNAEISGFTTRAINYYPDIASCKLVQETKNFGRISKKANYSLVYSSDQSFINDDTFLTKTFNIEDNLPIMNHSAYLIFGLQDPLVHVPNQTAFGSVSSTVSSALKRDAEQTPKAPEKPETAISTLVVDAINYALDAIKNNKPTNFFVDKISYSYDSANNSEVQVGIKYIYQRTSRL